MNLHLPVPSEVLSALDGSMQVLQEMVGLLREIRDLQLDIKDALVDDDLEDL